MKTLYESLLDIDNQFSDKWLMDDMLQELHASLCDDTYYRSKKTPEIIDDTLYLYPSHIYIRLQKKHEDIIKRICKAFKVDTVVCKQPSNDFGGIVFDHFDLSMFNKIKCIQVVTHGIYRIKNVNLQLIGEEKVGLSCRYPQVDVIEFENVNIEASCRYIDFGGFPKFKNCNIKGFSEMNIYTPNLNLINISEFTQAMDKVLDKKYNMKLADGGSRKTNIKSLRATLNNKKYVPAKQSDGKFEDLFRVNSDFRLKDIIDMSCFDKTLSAIRFADNSIDISFTKTPLLLKRATQDYKELPNDPRWWVEVKKHI